LTFSRFFRFLLILFCLAGGGGLPGGSLVAHAAQTTAAANGSAKAPPQSAAADEEEPSDDVYRHSASVRTVGRWLHLDQETAARLFEYLNFAVLAGAVLFALLKILPKTFRENKVNIQHRLLDARTATQQANERLSAIEQRLARLDEEILAISKQAEKDSVEDEARIKRSIEAERRRIVDATTKDISAAASAAQRELKRFAAGLAVDRAGQKMSLTEDDDRALLQEFTQGLSQQAHGGGKN
jgi:F-type H+-transporting ATPase subunit b